MSDKVQKEIFNAVNENVRALEQLFPAAVKDGQVDFDALKIELGKFEEAGTGVGTEKYEFVWNGKAKAKAEAVRDISGRTLKRKVGDGVDEDTTQNLYIEGDNLEALKLLRNSYYNRIKMIYIDPPYNTGNDFVYRDNFSMTDDELRAVEEESGDIDAEGNRLVKNSKDAAKYHTNWCNMIYPRLKIARDLLTDDGVIFISIDDNEVENLKKICNEIFGEQNFEGHIHWRRRHNQPNDKTKMVGLVAEHLLCYAKSSISLKEKGVGKIDLTGNFSNPDNDPLGDWASKPWKVGSDQNGSRYKIILPNGKVLDEEWMGEEKTYLELLAAKRIIFPRGGDGMPRKKYYKFEREEEGQCATNWWTCDMFGHNQGANDRLTSLLGVKNVFSNPKPIELMRGLLQIANVKKDDIVLDFFSGSGSIADALLLYNLENPSYKCKFILVQYPENLEKNLERATGDEAKTLQVAIDFLASINKPLMLSEAGKERIRRAGAKIQTELTETFNAYKNKQPSLLDSQEDINAPINPDTLDVGFKVFKVEDTNIRFFKSEINGEPLTIEKFIGDDQERLDFNAGYTDLDVIYELLIRHRGIPLTAKIDKLSAIGNRTFVIADTIVVCLEQKLDKSKIAKLAAIDPAPIKYIFRDSAFGDDINLKTNTMQELTALIEKKNDGKKKALKVEFI